MELVRWEPFEGLSKMQSRINDLFGESFGPSWATPSVATWYPPVDILESKDAYILRAELPGMKKEDFKLELKDGTLTLNAERKSEKTVDGVEYRSVERVNGKFFRSFSLPETVKHDGIEATYRDGILEIHVPKAEEAKPRQIEIAVH
jgi:HSP20 family protein